MSKMRVWEFARLAGLEVRVAVEELRRSGVPASNHAAGISREEAEQFWDHVEKGRFDGAQVPPLRVPEGRGPTGGGLWRRIWREVAAFRLWLVLMVGLELLATPLLLLTPVPLMVAVDSVLRGEPVPGFLDPVLPDVGGGDGLLVAVVFLQIGVVLVSQLRSMASYVVQTQVGERLTLRFRSRLFRRSQHLSLAYHDREGPMDTLYRIEYDAPSIQHILDSLIPFVSSFVILVMTVYVTARVHLGLALVAMAVAPVLFVLSRGYITRVRGRYRELKELESSALRVVQEVLSAVRVVKAFGREDSEERRFRHRSGDHVRARVGLSVAEGAFGLAINLTAALGTALVLLVGVRAVQGGTLSLGALLLVLGYLAQLYGPLQDMSQKVGDLQSSVAGAERAFELLDRHPEVAEVADARPLERARGEIVFERVWFTYDGVTAVLRDAEFSIEAGKRVGIVGHTGAGKTTLVSLITRFYDPPSGRVLMDGVDVREYGLADLRDQFSLVLQEPVLFSTTIAENLRYARPDAGEEEIVAAAEAAGAHGFVTALPDGYDTVVGERGMRLSGGERQRLSLARAFLKDAPVLILDEPTSAVDKTTESQIIDAMRRLMEGRTTLIITHRHSALADCDAFLEIDGGRVRMLDDPMDAVHLAEVGGVRA